MALTSQDLKLIFNDKNNDKDYPVEIFCAFNNYPIKDIMKADGKIIIITEAIGGTLVNSGDEEDKVEPEVNNGPMLA
jgi:hypothetical protein